MKISSVYRIEVVVYRRSSLCGTSHVFCNLCSLLTHQDDVLLLPNLLELGRRPRTLSAAAFSMYDQRARSHKRSSALLPRQHLLPASNVHQQTNVAKLVRFLLTPQYQPVRPRHLIPIRSSKKTPTPKPIFAARFEIFLCLHERRDCGTESRRPGVHGLLHWRSSALPRSPTHPRRPTLSQLGPNMD